MAQRSTGSTTIAGSRLITHLCLALRPKPGVARADSCAGQATAGNSQCGELYRYAPMLLRPNSATEEDIEFAGEIKKTRAEQGRAKSKKVSGGISWQQ